MPKTKATIVLVHGFVDFFKILKRFRCGYWRDLPQVMENAFNVRVLAPEMTSGASPIKMAEELKTYLLGTAQEGPIYFIADSMGGLTVRFLLSKHGLDCASRFNVLGVATIGTPHHGTAIADILLGPDGNDKFAILLFKKLGLEGLSHMTREALTRFNIAYADCPVKIFSYGGSINYSLRYSLFLPLLATNQVLSRYEGDNDGLVSVNSAKWGTYVKTIGADHAAQIGHFLGPEYFDYQSFYLQVVNKLLEIS